MSVFYQHIGEALWRRDAPKSIGTPEGGLRRFRLPEIEKHLQNIPPSELAAAHSKMTELAPTGFQVWGLPEGARDAIKNMEDGDFLMLLENTDFKFVGQVLHRLSEPCWDLSRHIWGEARFPLVVFLQGELTSYPWTNFCADFSFADGYHMRGNTMRLSSERIGSSPWQTEEGFISHLLTTTGVNPEDQASDFQAFANNLQIHLRMVKARAAQQRFRQGTISKQGMECAFCSMSIPEVLEAAHIVPKEHDGADDHRNALVLCALHHRMFDSGLLRINPNTRSVLAGGSYSLDELRVTRHQIAAGPQWPHERSLRWRWERGLG
ncbi:HNH endonuclease [Methylobacterium durans]|uniref:HNH nuclease domain-containing protein n=1 Tax=Methylobacterium durans TaxID=2202825 RepID=A0A2U8W6L4_9HYPH|nr:HNH endonuclease signature motif containing protein [Methylobacterium durans]AWN41160.1 hypothetical protein DK389_12285 [Methylobacterium durans]